MKIELDRIGLETLAKGWMPNYHLWEHPLVLKAGSCYIVNGTSCFEELHKLTDEELYELYVLCRNSWIVANIITNHS
jgi:hypothetical protein